MFFGDWYKFKKKAWIFDIKIIYFEYLAIFSDSNIKDVDKSDPIIFSLIQRLLNDNNLLNKLLSSL